MFRLHKNLTRLIAISLLAASALAAAKDDGTDHSFSIDKDIRSYVVNSDGSFVLTSELMLTINEERAIASQAQRNILYNSDLETVDIVEAYTQKPDGRKIAVRPDQIREQEEPQSVNAPMFQDQRIKTVIFPEVAVGDKIAITFRQNQKTPVFPDNFASIAAPNFVPTKEFSMIFDAPETMHLYFDAVGFSKSSPAAKPGRKVYRWDYQPGDNARLEADSIDYLDYGKHLIVSTFPDYASIARAYEARAEDKSKPTSKIVELAKQVTAKLDDPRAKAVALADWVKKNIRYVAVYVGAGGWVPHPADVVLDNRYGDCKDHATLLGAMLSAVGIDSTPALINTGSLFSLPKASSPFVFSHAITYVPGLDLYLDSTNPWLASGYIAQSEWDKPTLIIRGGTVGHTPSVQPTMNLYVSEFKIDANGAADFTHASTISAWGAEPRRYAFRNAHPTDLAMLPERILQNYGFRGTGTLDAGDLNGEGDYKFNVAGHIDNLVNLPGPVGMQALTGIGGGLASWVIHSGTEKTRTQPYMCYSGETKEQSTFRFPKSVNILGIPSPMSIHDANIDYTSEYKRQENDVTVTRHIVFHHKGAICTPEDFKTIRPALDQMMRDLTSQIVVQGT